MKDQDIYMLDFSHPTSEYPTGASLQSTHYYQHKLDNTINLKVHNIIATPMMTQTRIVPASQYKSDQRISNIVSSTPLIRCPRLPDPGTNIPSSSSSSSEMILFSETSS